MDTARNRREDCVLLAGATGLIGGEVLRRLGRAHRTPVVVVSRRRPDDGPPDAKVLLGELEDPAQDAAMLERVRAASQDRPLGTFIGCLGTTIRRAGSQAAFETIDRGLVVRLATLARDLGAAHAIVVSSVGADAGSGNFYLGVKGRMEREVAGLGFARADFLRPGLLLGDRSERRAGEAIARGLAPVFNPVLMGPLRRYRAISASDVAAAVVALLGAPPPGVFGHAYDDLMRLAAAPARAVPVGPRP
jgi:uncharacterized protein YbjT (DUF2867 family)